MPERGPVERSVGGPVVPPQATTSTARRRVIDLGLAIDRGSRVPFPDQLERDLRALVARHELAPGTALPSSRALAAELEVSRGVVVEAYDRLVRQGLLIARQGGAVRISPTLRAIDAPATQAPAAPELAPAPAFELDLHPAGTPIGTLDRRAWGAALRTALRTATEAELGSLDRAGLLALREALASQLARSRGVVAVPEQMAITSGTTDSLRGLAPLFAQRGGRVAVEQPGFGLHRATLIGSGLDVVPIDTDEHGIDVEALAREEVAAVLVTPAHQMPMGVPLAPERRAALVDWARANDTWILEDDYDGELRYDRRGVRSLHGLAPDRVLYLGTTSKVLSPAVRVGWIVAPPQLVDEVLGWRVALGGAPANLLQAGLTDYLRSGAFDRGISRMRRRCAAQREAIVRALAQALPELEVGGVEAGLHVALRVPGIEPWKLVVAGQQRGTQIFATDDAHDALLLIGFGTIEPGAAPRVAAEVAAVVAAARAAG